MNFTKDSSRTGIGMASGQAGRGKLLIATTETRNIRKEIGVVLTGGLAEKFRRFAVHLGIAE
jgi:hypothetical protein